jgi:NUMOD4 motif/HNH endonuclease
MEKWVDIKGFEGLYQISINGNVKSVDRFYNTGFGNRRTVKVGGIKILKISKCGYKIVQLYKNGKPFTRSIHRLIAEGFIDNPENLRVVNHKDGNKLNNNVTNLEWCSDKENTVHYHQVIKKQKALSNSCGKQGLRTALH